jgi:hypothetical protein
LILALAFVARLAEIALDIGYASPARTASRLGQHQNPQQRGPSQYFNRLLSLDLGQRRGFVSKETKRKVSQFCLLDIGGLRCLRENRDAVVTRWRFRRVL